MLEKMCGRANFIARPIMPVPEYGFTGEQKYRAAILRSRDRVADCDTLERCCTRKGIVSSNLTDSANIKLDIISFLLYNLRKGIIT